MALTEDKIRGYVQRLLLSRMRILCHHGFYGLLLMHMRFSVDEEVPTACTDGVRIIFGTDFLDGLSDSELDFVMMHEILHVVLQHCLRQSDRDPNTFNVACDIVVNSNILLENGMDLSTITLVEHGEAMHLAPDGKEGYEYTAEQVYEMLPHTPRPQKKAADKGGDGGGDGGESDEDGKNGNGGKSKGKGGGTEKESATGTSDGSLWDDHSRWGSQAEEDEALRDVWAKRLEDAAASISVRDPSNERGLLPLFAKRLLEQLRPAQTDWRTVLSEFIQEEVVDYSFVPPDRRFADSPFLLHDFNDKEDMVEDVLFMVDTSGSMSDSMVAAAYSEIKGAIDQFDGRLKGWLGFFDAAIIEPKPFTSEEEFRVIHPAGGGGTDFQIIFEYVARHMERPPASIVILTDGYAPFPRESLAMDIPVLWLLNNDEVQPPWGRVARIHM